MWALGSQYTYQVSKYLWSTYHMPGTLLCIYSHNSTVQHFNEVDIITIPTLQMKNCN